MSAPTLKEAIEAALREALSAEVPAQHVPSFVYGYLMASCATLPPRPFSDRDVPAATLLWIEKGINARKQVCS